MKEILMNPICEKRKGSEESNMEQDTFRIYEFLKSNPGVIAGIGSVLVVVLSAIINFCYYAYDSAVLCYWDIDAAYMDISLPSRIHGTVVSFVFVVVFFGCMAVLEMLAKRRGEMNNYKIYLKQLSKCNRKQLVNLHWKRFIKRMCCEQYDDTEEQIAANRKRAIDGYMCQFKKTNKIMSKKITRIAFLLWFFLTISLYVWVSLEDSFVVYDYTMTQVLLFAISAVMSVFFLAMMHYSLKSSYIHRKMSKKQAEKDYISGEIKKSPKAGIPEDSVHIEKVIFRFSDKSFFRQAERSIFAAILLIFAIVIIFHLLGNATADGQRTWKIVSEDATQYAIVYTNGEVAVLAGYGKNKNGDYVVDSTIQKIVSVNELEYVIDRSSKAQKGYLDEPVCP